MTCSEGGSSRCTHQVVGRFKSTCHSAALLSEKLTHDLTLWREQGGNRYDKTSCQGQAQGSQLKCDEDIKKATLLLQKQPQWEYPPYRAGSGAI